MLRHAKSCRTGAHFSLIACLLYYLLCSSSARATITFEKWIGEAGIDYGNSVAQTYDGGYVITGWKYFNGTGKEDVYLIKTDSLGDTLWTRTYGDTSEDYGWSVAQTYDGGYIITGWTKRFFGLYTDMYLIKTDSLGDTLWTRSFGDFDNNRGYSAVQTNDRGYAITGLTDSYGAIGFDVYFSKIDSLGDTLWTRTYGGTDADQGFSVARTCDGGYVITGLTDSYGAGMDDVYLIKTDSLGDTLWTRTYGGASYDRGWSVTQTYDGGYVITGSTQSYGAGMDDVYLIKTDSLGDTLWTRTFGGTAADYGNSVVQASDGGYVITGSTHSYGDIWGDVYLIKIDSLGDTLWTRTFGGASTEYGNSVARTTDCGYIITGATSSYGAGMCDVYLIKTDSLGKVGVEEEEVKSVKSNRFSPAIFAGPLQLPEGENCKVFDITGREVKPHLLAPGIYFIEIDGKITQKVVKVR